MHLGETEFKEMCAKKVHGGIVSQSGENKYINLLTGSNSGN